jgi:quercetin dioxygenase-like cupin family protein
MKITYPHTIENGLGEKIIFHSVQKEPDGDRVIVENFVTPGHGSIMHTHFVRDESLTVVKGNIEYQVIGQEKQYGRMLGKYKKFEDAPEPVIK